MAFVGQSEKSRRGGDKKSPTAPTLLSLLSSWKVACSRKSLTLGLFCLPDLSKGWGLCQGRAYQIKRESKEAKKIFGPDCLGDKRCKVREAVLQNQYLSEDRTL